jgi:hypothetical protein
LVLQPPTLSVNRTVTLPNGTGTLALTSDISYPVTSVFGRTGAVVATSGDYTTTLVTEGTNLYFTDSRARLALSFVAGSGAYNSTTGVITIPTNNTQITNGSNYITLGSLSAGTGISYNNTTGVITNSLPDQTVALTASTGISVTGTYPNFTITNTSPSSGGTVTSVAALTIGTTGTDLSSTVATSTTTPVITLNVPTASAANRGALSSADWTTFNNKQNALTNPVTGTGTTNYLPKFTGASTIGNSQIFDNGTQVGIGTATNTSIKLQVTTTAAEVMRLQGTSGGGSNNTQLRFYGSASAADLWAIGTEVSTGSSGRAFDFYDLVAGANRMRLDASGNLGLGVTPSAWQSFRGLQVGQVGSFASNDFGSGNIQTFFGNNVYYDNTGFKYIQAGVASMMRMTSISAAQWEVATTGTAGNAISFTQAMTLTAAGRLLIGTPTEATYMLDVNGTGRFSGAVNIATTSGYLNVGTTVVSGFATYIKAGASGLLLSAGTTSSDNAVLIQNAAETTTLLTIKGTGAATFSSSVTATAADGTVGLKVIGGTGRFVIFPYYDATEGVLINSYNTAESGYKPMSFQASAFRFSQGAATFSSSVTATSFFESSDSRLKTLIQDNYQTKGIASITPKLYTKNGKVELGYYAQDFVGILDSAVSKGSDDMLSLSYREVLVAKVYALEQRIKELEAKLN